MATPSGVRSNGRPLDCRSTMLTDLEDAIVLFGDLAGTDQLDAAG